MKKLSFIFLAGISIASNAQTHKLEKLWQTDTIVAVPESVLPDISNKILYVSLIDGGGWDADGKGGVGKIDPDGKNYNGTWITGLNAPKGLGMYNGKLYAADISEVVVIDMKTGRVEKKIAIDSANGLNDITVDNKGNVYVSDSRKAKIWRIENGVSSVYLNNIKGANGLKAIGNDLLFAQGNLLQKANAQKQITKIAELPAGIDGIEPIGNGDFIVTAWQGYIWYVSANGTIETLLDTHEAKKNTADIGYDPVKKIVYVPSFNGKTVAAYLLK
jgi:sugar lactone lactonase YvrE